LPGSPPEILRFAQDENALAVILSAAKDLVAFPYPLEERPLRDVILMLSMLLSK